MLSFSSEHPLMLGTQRIPIHLIQEINMKIVNPVFPLCTAVLLTSFAGIAGDSTATGVMRTPEQITWKDNPRVRGLGVARIVGSAKKPGAFVHRVKFPAGRVVQSHSHPDDRTYTVLSGTWYIGWGNTYEPEKLTALPAGSFYTEPAGVPHFITTPDGETIVQVTGTGPSAVHYVNPDHAPKKK